jgi:hypothetical protein
MADIDLGMATIAYDDPDGETVKETVENERIAYFQDHWVLKRDEDESGNDIVRRIPLQRVHYVERNVEEFEEEVATLRNQVESFADNLRSRVFGDDERSDRDERIDHGDHDDSNDSGPVEIDVENDDDR